MELQGSAYTVQQIFNAAGRELALEVIAAVWLPLVEQGTRNKLAINMGGDLMRPGQRWEVFALGESVPQEAQRGTRERVCLPMDSC